MSNTSIIKQLLHDVEIHFSPEDKSNDDFAEHFMNNIEALEGVPYAVIEAGREWQYQIEIQGFSDEEECETDPEKLKNGLTKWLQDLKEQYK